MIVATVQLSMQSTSRIPEFVTFRVQLVECSNASEAVSHWIHMELREVDYASQGITVILWPTREQPDSTRAFCASLPLNVRNRQIPCRLPHHLRVPSRIKCL